MNSQKLSFVIFNICHTQLVYLGVDIELVVYLGVDICLDPVSIPWSSSMSKNHGHTWTSSGSVLAVVESASFQCLHGFKNLPKVRLYLQ